MFLADLNFHCLRMTRIPPPSLPFPIYFLSCPRPRYLLYDTDTIAYLRSVHSILGVLIGTLPQIPQQSVFLGLPLELLPEEAHLLVDKGIAFLVDDRSRHDEDFRHQVGEQRDEIIARLRKEGLEIAREMERKKRGKRAIALKQMKEKGKGIGPSSIESPIPMSTNEIAEAESSHEGNIVSDGNSQQTPPQTDGISLFSPPQEEGANSEANNHPQPPSPPSSPHRAPFYITPTNTIPPPAPPTNSSSPASFLLTKTPTTSTTPAKLALHAHLHTLSYTLTPGLRFGAHFSVYPGDPLRYHSHFLANAYDWDEEIDLIDVIAGGRLATGVKKGWMIGGLEAGADDDGIEGEGEHDERGVRRDTERETGRETRRVRTFCVEWGGM